MEVTAKVVELRENEHKISLSIKAMDQSEDDAEVETVEGDNE
jgi:predicted RNA-binding protein with RPS1 domain